MPEDWVLRVDQDGGEVARNHDVGGVLRTEAEEMLAAFCMLLKRKVYRDWLIQNTEVEMDCVRSALWQQLWCWLLQGRAEEYREMRADSGRLREELEKDYPWYQVVAPLALCRTSRVAWVWRLVNRSLDHGLWDNAALAQALEQYRSRHDSPVRLDYVIEVKIRLPVLPGRLDCLATYRRATGDDGADILVRPWEED